MPNGTAGRGDASARQGLRPSPAVAVLGLTLAMVLGATSACGADRTPRSTAPPPSPSSSPSTLVLDEHARLTTVRIRTGTAVLVRLHSTYWSTPTTSDARVLVPGGHGSSPAGTCPPGGGCGVTSARFTAARPGTSHVTAHRTSCGEAMRCPPGQDTYTVTVSVTD